MAHILGTVLGAAEALREAIKQPPFGPGFSAEQLPGITRLETWGSDFNEPGDDYCEFRAFAGDRKIATRRVAGF